MKTKGSRLAKWVMFSAGLMLLILGGAWWIAREPEGEKLSEMIAVPEPAVARPAVPVLRPMPIRVERAEAIPDRESIEVLKEPRRLDSWNPGTDPDHMWHGQMRRARETLIRHDVPASALRR
jgi:hypothetical protein